MHHAPLPNHPASVAPAGYPAHMRRHLLQLSVLVLVACPEPTVQDLPDPATRPADTDPVSIDGETIVAVTYNVESGDAQAATVAERVAEVQGEVLWGFTEVASQAWLDVFAAAADDGNQDFQTALGSTGNSDRLGIVWDATVLEWISTQELNSINVGGTARAPMVAEFEVRANGQRFLYMVNHLWRTDDALRLEQAELLNEWAVQQTLPVVAMGDYNFDWNVEGGETDHDPGYDALVAGDRWVWVRPDVLIQTQCSFENRSVLDFAFMAGAARSWDASSEILFPQNVHCQDDEFKSDHRPVLLEFTVPD